MYNPLKKYLKNLKYSVEKWGLEDNPGIPGFPVFTSPKSRIPGSEKSREKKEP